MTSKTSWQKKLWHAMKNIGAINSRHANLWCHEKSWIAMKICDTLPNGMPCHHHMEDQVVINCKRQQYSQLVNK
jgi:hypothetical protein